MCWKKVGKDIYRNEERQTLTIGLRKTKRSWEVGKNQKIIAEDFKTKNSATRWAKTYMKKHDKC